MREGVGGRGLRGQPPPPQPPPARGGGEPTDTDTDDAASAGFWRRDGVLPRLLSPLAAVTAAVTARRVARPGWRAAVPVICCGNVTIGGAGKTTLALDLGARLAARGRAVHFLLRGYGGAVRGPHQRHRRRHRRQGG